MDSSGGEQVTALTAPIQAAADKGLRPNITTLVCLGWMLICQRTRPQFFAGASMRLGLSLTDDDEIVRVADAGAGPDGLPADAGDGRPGRERVLLRDRDGS